MRCNMSGLDCLAKNKDNLAVLKAPWANKTGLFCDCLPSCTEIETSTIQNEKYG